MSFENFTAVDVFSWIGCLTALVASYLLSSNSSSSKWGFVLYLFSNAAWVCVSLYTENFALLVMQIGFTITSLRGIIKWFHRDSDRGALTTV